MTELNNSTIDVIAPAVEGIDIEATPIVDTIAEPTYTYTPETPDTTGNGGIVMATAAVTVAVVTGMYFAGKAIFKKIKAKKAAKEQPKLDEKEEENNNEETK